VAQECRLTAALAYLDPLGEVVARTPRHIEAYLEAAIDVGLNTPFVRHKRSVRSARVLAQKVVELTRDVAPPVPTEPERL
jgi:hypothetical protein